MARDQQHGDKAQRKRQILALHAQGWSYRQISAEVGLHWTRVGQIVKSMKSWSRVSIIALCDREMR